MKSQARCVVIGGGIAGCSTLYHLTQEGWSDVALVERDELTSGTTWHSAAQVTNFGMNRTMVGLKSHSIRLYRELAEDPEHPVNYHHADGGMRIAHTEAQMDAFRHFASVARGMGVDYEVINAQECGRRHPLISTQGIVGALWDPLDGNIDPSQLCHALARRARRAGAEVHTKTPVTGLTQRRDHGWTVHTEAGDIDCEVVVNACGYRVNEVAAMMGVQHPVMAMEHQYMLTGPIPQIAEAGRRMPLVRCAISDFYCRQDGQGLLVGFYEQKCRTWGMDGIDPAFTSALCPDDLERISDVLEGAFMRLPALRETEIRSVINGPITYTPDGPPLVGPVPGRRGAHCIVGLRVGIGEGGGLGWLLAQQIVHGEACLDTWPLDPRRFNAHGTVELTALKAIEEYQNEFRIELPGEHRPAGRPLKTTPLTPALEAAGADFTLVGGWERADYYRPSPEFTETPGFRFSEAFDVVAAEVAAVQGGVGLSETSGFGRFEISGRDALGFLDRIACGRLPKRPGRVGLCYLLNRHGMLKSEATVSILPDGTVWYCSAAAAEAHDRDWLEHSVRAGEQVEIRPLTDSMTLLVLAGPKSREVMQAVSRGDWSAEAFGWLSARRCSVGIAPAVVMGVSFSGELAYEIHLPNSQLRGAFATLREAGAAHNMTLFGAQAVESMRLEKGFLHWKADILTEHDPIETGLARFVDMSKPDFTGKDALAARLDGGGPRRKLATLEILGREAHAHGGALALHDGAAAGFITSGAWGHRTGMNLAYAFLDAERAEPGTELEVEIIGTPTPARVIPPCPYDPGHARARA